MNTKDFFLEVGYKETSWKSTRTRMSKVIDVVIGETISDETMRAVLEVIANSSSALKNKAKLMLSNIKVTKPKEKVVETVVTPIEIPSDLLIKYSVSLEDVLVKHAIVCKAIDYKAELLKKLDSYRFAYDKAIVRLLLEVCDDK